MPIFNRHYVGADQRHSPAALESAGPILDVEVNIPQPLMDLLSSQNKPVPTPSPGWALIDTGASRTCVDGTLLSRLGINPIGIVSVGTAGGTVQCQLFPARLDFPAIGMRIDFGSVVSVDLQGQTINEKPVIALIGRDVLSRGLLIYAGRGGFFSLAF